MKTKCQCGDGYVYDCFHVALCKACQRDKSTWTTPKWSKQISFGRVLRQRVGMIRVAGVTKNAT